MSTCQRIAKLCALLPIVGLIGCIHRPALKPYTGTWTLRGNRTGEDANITHPIMAMQIAIRHHKLKGCLVQPSHFTEEVDGSFQHLELPLKTSVIDGERFSHPLFDILLKEPQHVEYIPIMLVDKDHLVMGGFPGLVPPWRFERVPQLPNLDIFKDQ